MVGSRQMILVENNGLAHTENFTLVDAAGLSPRDLVPVTITGHNGRHLTMRTDTATPRN
jgi:threonylcarbamoyladenosine tRNA methylthiotransferase MtaB